MTRKHAARPLKLRKTIIKQKTRQHVWFVTKLATRAHIHTRCDAQSHVKLRKSLALSH